MRFKVLKCFTLAMSLWGSAQICGAFQTGDLILQESDCYLCRAIQSETGGPYVHLGLVVKTKDGVKVIHTLSGVEMIALSDFLRLGQKNDLYRGRRLESGELLERYKEFEGVAYDPYFLWDDSALYCSELIYWLLEGHKDLRPRARAMTFEHGFWESYYQRYQMLPPWGELGLAPNHFAQHPRWKKIRSL